VSPDGLGWASATSHHRRGVYPQLILPGLRALPETVTAAATGLPRRTINGLRGGRTPKPATQRRLIVGLAQLCRNTHQQALLEPSLTDVAARWSRGETAR
jgi:hypothetical protein